jgi:PBP1b-binding outer membrane lipoprotein LpoB
MEPISIMKSYIYTFLVALLLLLGGCQDTRSQSETTTATTTETINAKETVAVPFEVSSPERLDDAVRQIVGQNIPAPEK